MDTDSTDTHSNCPICDKVVSIKEIERHVNNCLFLNSNNESSPTTSKRKRESTESPQPLKQRKSITNSTTVEAAPVIANTIFQNSPKNVNSNN